MRNLSLVLLALALVTTLPGVLATTELHIEVEARVSTGALPLGAPIPPTPQVGVGDQAPQLPIEIASVKAESTGDGGAEVDVRADTAPQEDSQGEPISSMIIPAVEKAAPPAVATVGIVALLQAMGAWRVLGLGAVGLYSRLTKSDLLDNQHRDRVYKLIQETPGLGVSEIAEKSGLGWGTTVYHLDRLERAGFVANERGGLHKCFYPVGTVAREARKGMGALKADTARNIAEFLIAKPGATQSELCDALGLSPSAASKQVSKLEGAGLVRRERDWKTVHLYPQETLPALLTGGAQAQVQGATLAAPLAA